MTPSGARPGGGQPRSQDAHGRRRRCRRQDATMAAGVSHPPEPMWRSGPQGDAVVISSPMSAAPAVTSRVVDNATGTTSAPCDPRPRPGWTPRAAGTAPCSPRALDPTAYRHTAGRPPPSRLPHRLPRLPACPPPAQPPARVAADPLPAGRHTPPTRRQAYPPTVYPPAGLPAYRVPPLPGPPPTRSPTFRGPPPTGMSAYRLPRCPISTPGKRP